jgi:hypothetical protein
MGSKSLDFLFKALKGILSETFLAGTSRLGSNYLTSRNLGETQHFLMNMTITISIKENPTSDAIHITKKIFESIEVSIKSKSAVISIFVLILLDGASLVFLFRNPILKLFECVISKTVTKARIKLFPRIHSSLSRFG